MANTEHIHSCTNCPDYDQCPRKTWFLEYDPQHCHFRQIKTNAREFETNAREFETNAREFESDRLKTN